MPDRRLFSRSSMAGVVNLALVVMAVAALWPASLGGHALFVIVHGNSMEPTYHAGDTVYARTTDRFEVGQIALYKIPAGEPGAGSMVIHRIRDRAPDGRYIMQGDNRPTEDGALPNPTDLYARPVISLGSAPRHLLIVTPWAMTLTIALTLGWYLWPHDGPDRRERALSPDPTGPAARTAAGVDTAPVIAWVALHSTRVAPRAGAAPADQPTIERPLPAPGVGVDLTDPFKPDTPLLNMQELLDFIAAADQAMAVRSPV